MPQVSYGRKGFITSTSYRREASVFAASPTRKVDATLVSPICQTKTVLFCQNVKVLFA